MSSHLIFVKLRIVLKNIWRDRVTPQRYQYCSAPVHCADDLTFSNQREMSVIALDCLIVALFAGILLVFHFSLPTQPQATTPNRTTTSLNRTSTSK
jgi:hypothetical protein